MTKLLFTYLLAIPVSFCACEVSSYFVHFNVFFLWLLIYSSLSIPNIKSVSYIMQIISASLWFAFFMFLMVSFDEQVFSNFEV